MFDHLSAVPQADEGTLVCVTPWSATLQAQARAEALAAWFRCPLVPRGRRSIEQVFAEEGVSGVLVAEDPPRLYHRAQPGQPFFFHPGLARPRLAALAHGLPDRLLRVAGIRPGDVVVDATLGTGTDSLVLAYGVGPDGRVIAIESSWVLARLFAWAKRENGHGYPGMRELLARIEVVYGDNEQVMAAMASDSADVVYFDPMFRRPIAEQDATIAPARPWTDPRPLSDAAWREAQRIARRCVVLKERPASDQFARFGLVPDKPRAKIAFGVWNKEREAR
ncbi:class I SAM-dependent methyltransferase [Alicyclobacillus sp.]|uniref:class I SAM-dependent methyltransferase n=1 Tax=Alicyclobacillus sp. TaxID=61169 RepID=UPI0025BC4C49|nr:class I SAM-dependent methyltransferase [Alicyclobacillus sp.]MCL6518092.1 class I SAM-dependent methyltransferase [Alicyclobacillus sp.]